MIFNYLGIEKSVFLPTFIKNFIIKFKNLDSINISQNNILNLENEDYQKINNFEEDNEDEDENDDEISLISDEENNDKIESNKLDNNKDDEISELSNLEDSLNNIYEKLNKKIDNISNENNI